jgi:ABC-type glycerol-3-phosphate transport system substrate-binding protein
MSRGRGIICYDFLFDRYGVAYPQIRWTWNDFLDVALALRSPDNDIFGYAPTNSEEAAHFVYQHVKPPPQAVRG